MYTKDQISKIASRLFVADVKVKYTTKGKNDHSFKKGRDSIAVYDNPKSVKRFNVVFSGKDWEDGNIKTILKMNENGSFMFTTGREDNSLGTPVVWNSFPKNLQKIALDQMKGGYDSGYTQAE